WPATCVGASRLGMSIGRALCTTRRFAWWPWSWPGLTCAAPSRSRTLLASLTIGYNRDRRRRTADRFLGGRSPGLAQRRLRRARRRHPAWPACREPDPLHGLGVPRPRHL